MFRLYITRARIAAPFLAFALVTACSNGGSTPSPVATLTPVPVYSSTIATTGVAYIPDGGTGASGRTGIAVIHIVDISANLLSSTGAMGAPEFVTFPSAVGPFAITPDGTDAISADAAAGGPPPYTNLQDIFGGIGSLLTPAGMPYVTTIAPTPAPTTSPSVSPSPTIPPTIADVTSLGIVESSGLSTTADVMALGNEGILGITGVTNTPLAFANFIPYNDASYTDKTIPMEARNTVALSADSPASVALVRGPNDLIAFAISQSMSGYELNATAENGTLGAGTLLRGRGGVAVDPVSSQFALVVGPNQASLLSGLPSAITVASTATVTAAHSVAWYDFSPNAGAFAVVGVDGGFYILSVTTSGTPAITATSALMTPPPFLGCDGAQDHLTAVDSVGFFNQYLIVYGPSSATGCAAGTNGALEAYAFPVPGVATPTPSPVPTAAPSATASPTPIPTLFVQNNLSPPNASQDYMVIR